MASTITSDDGELFTVTIYYDNGRPAERHVAVSETRANELEALINTKPAINQLKVAPYGLDQSAEAATIDALGSALRAVHARLNEAYRSGDEWAAEFMIEDWPHLVPESVGLFLGIGED